MQTFKKVSFLRMLVELNVCVWGGGGGIHKILTPHGPAYPRQNSVFNFEMSKIQKWGGAGLARRWWVVERRCSPPPLLEYKVQPKEDGATRVKCG
jgi:hypothetical protein